MDRLQEWFETRLVTRPIDIPKNPDEYYAGRGWVNWGEFLLQAMSDLRTINGVLSKKLETLLGNLN